MFYANTFSSNSSLSGLQTSSSGSHLSGSQRASLDQARELYEVPLSEGLQQRHADNQERVAAAIAAFFDEQPGAVLPQDRPSRLATDLYRVLKRANFDPVIYQPREHEAAHGYGKYLLFSDDNAGVPYCLQIFAFGEHQKTPIHDHPCECTSVVFKGALKERLYRALPDGMAFKYAKRLRPAGSVEALDPSVENIHSLKNDSAVGAVSVHLYHLDGVGQPAAVNAVFTRGVVANVAQSAWRHTAGEAAR